MVTDRSVALVELGRAFLDAHPFPDFVASTTGGSVARGEADEFSDLDINIFVDADEGYSANREFKGETIQVHIRRFPTMEVVRQSAWGYRFLKEAGIVTDPTGRYQTFALDALNWLDSDDGRLATISGALGEVEERRSWTERSIQDGDRVGAGMASVATMTDAALLYQALTSDIMTTSGPLTRLLKSQQAPEIDVPWMGVRVDEADTILGQMEYHRRWLSERNNRGQDFILDDVQNQLERRKAARLVSRNDDLLLGETLYQETFWVINARANRPIDGHLSSVPRTVREALRKIGFDEPGEATVSERLDWVDLMVRQCID